MTSKELDVSAGGLEAGSGNETEKRRSTFYYTK